SPAWVLTAGARWDDLDYSVSDRTGGSGSGDTSFQQFSPMLGLSWSRNPSLGLYGNVSTSFDPPTFTELANPDGPTGFNQNLDPQTATNYELGAKGVMTNRLHYELAVFHINVDDEIVPFELEGSGQSFFRNAGKSTHNGVEAGLTLQLAPGLTGRLAYTWSDFSFKSFSAPGGGNYDGNQLPGSPQNQFNLDFAWQHSSGFYAGADFLYVGSFYADNANTVETDAYFLSNLRAGFRWNSAGWFIQPFVGLDNIFNEEYMDNIRINAAFGRYYEPAPERNIYAGVELSYGFN
ncbi:MAG TPA: TonB-dependent receptor, partial [Xanthomonadales bacterium]|nr:TonB-dependent receptor [Xanthomonadales bacterium]